MTGCCVAPKCPAAWRRGESSQQPTWPHVRHSRSATQTVPSARHSSHAPGVRGGGKSTGVNPSRCSHGVGIGFLRGSGCYSVRPRVRRLAPLAPRAKRGTSLSLRLELILGRQTRMFVGHYSSAFVAKAAAPHVPLWTLLLAAQLVDILW